MTLTVDIDNLCGDQWVPEIRSCRDWMEATLELLQHDDPVSLGVQYVSRERSRELNLHYRHKKSATNVLSFPASLPPDVIGKLGFQPLGDLVICPDLLQTQAARQNKPLQSHWAHIIVHGLLHLLGHDHNQPQAAARMENLEIGVLKKFGIANPYLIG